MSIEGQVREAISAAEISACAPVILQLRPHVNPAELVQRVEQQQKEEGYRLIYISDGESPAAICGFRILNFLFSGKTVYIDDLCTLSSTHRKGYAGKLLDWVDQYAIEQNCDSITLDSGYSRRDAHRLYLNKRFNLASHHFHKNLK